VKIYTILRTRNEEKNLDRFICSYLLAGVDKILIADGGSTDDTVSIAKNYWMSGVEVRNYTDRVYGLNGLWRNGEGKHLNYLIDWALGDGADWVILQDCDCVPNKLLQESLRREIEFAECDSLKVIQATLIYMYGQDQYFPELNKPGPSLYAWHKDSGIRFSEVDPWNVDLVSQEPIKRGTFDIPLPACCLHYFCPDPETMVAKHNFYKNSGQQPSHLLPTESCGPLESIQDWMRWR
jgi:glycosyltransferase involved in cell wall biosynthesis